MVDYSFFNLMGDASNGPPKVYQLAPNGIVTVNLQGKITISCVMDFSHYPFDKQVRKSKQQKQISFPEICENAINTLVFYVCVSVDKLN